MIQKLFRLTESEVNTLKQIAEERGCSQTDVIRQAIRDISRDIQKDIHDIYTENEEKPDSKTIELLAKQIETKDKQIASLQEQLSQTTSALLAAQESVKAAQTLHAVDKKEEVLSFENEIQKQERVKSHWWQFWK